MVVLCVWGVGGDTPPYTSCWAERIVLSFASRCWFRCLDVLFFFFFKQKTAYEMQRGLVGSEMCIRDSKRGEQWYNSDQNEKKKLVELKREAKKAGNYYVPADAKVAFLSLIHI
eukprot:TRINITY_DN6662_c0_g1_i1.p3 TRINITY_DN6662_c0_g1~~TRINITY_DN6662_c0_g1_i1.p3  ORF type:complete len:114 (+),score=35.57 TRINITY_DN6662_c0_g1_i1:3-344(+)